MKVLPAWVASLLCADFRMRRHRLGIGGEDTGSFAGTKAWADVDVTMGNAARVEALADSDQELKPVARFPVPEESLLGDGACVVGRDSGPCGAMFSCSVLGLGLEPLLFCAD